MPVRQVEIEKIGHGSVMNPVKDISERSSDDERQGSNHKAVARLKRPNKKPRRDGSREECEEPRWQFMTTQHSETNGPIPAEHKIEERRDADGLGRLHGIFEDPPLCCLIYEEPRAQSEKLQPVQ